MVIPHFNRSGLLAETVESVRTQDYPSWEVIVVDDGSRPAEFAAAEKLACERTRVLQRSDGDKGPSRCRNLGAIAARGEFLLFLDSDDLLAPWCLRQRVEAALAKPNCDLWVFQVLLFREHPGDTSTCWNRLEGENDLQRFLCSDPPWHTSSPLWARPAFERLEGFNERVMYGDDADLHMRALLAGLRAAKFPKKLPDAFIRRGEQPRITSGLTPELVASRRVRLAEGSQALREMQASSKELALWEGQYFVEGEELMFNLPDANPAIHSVLVDWFDRYPVSSWRRAQLRSYFRLGLVCRTRAYWLLRLARRLAKIVLPSSYFPPAGAFASHTLEHAADYRVRELLNA